MTEVSKSQEYNAAHTERLGKFNEGVRQLTKGLLKESFPDNPIKPEEHISTFMMARTTEGKLGILISKPSKD